MKDEDTSSVTNNKVQHAERLKLTVQEGTDQPLNKVKKKKENEKAGKTS